jgi:hypothetical protein
VTPFQVQTSAFNVNNDSGVTDAYVLDLDPIINSPITGMTVSFIPLNSNLTTTPTLVLGSGTPYQIQLSPSVFVVPGDISNGSIAQCTFNGNIWILLTPALSAGGGNGDTFASGISLLQIAIPTGGYTLVTTALETTLDFSSLVVATGSFGGTFPNATSINLDNLTTATGNFNPDIDVVTALDLPLLATIGGFFDVNDTTALSFTAPSLTDVTGNMNAIFNGATTLDLTALTTVGGYFSLSYGGGTVDLSALVSVGGKFTLTLPNVTSIDLSALTTITGVLSMNNFALVSTVDFPSIVTIGLGIQPDFIGMAGVQNFSLGSGLLLVGGDVEMKSAAFTQATVDGILVSLAALDGTGGTTSYDNHDVDLSGGTSATPSATGLTAKATLILRGNTVTTN